VFSRALSMMFFSRALSVMYFSGALSVMCFSGALSVTWCMFPWWTLLHIGIMAVTALQSSLQAAADTAVLYCTVLYCVYCSVLYCTVQRVLFCSVLYCTVLYSVYCSVLYCHVLSYFFLSTCLPSQNTHKTISTYRILSTVMRNQNLTRHNTTQHNMT
jgi:hypothetical protein